MHHVPRVHSRFELQRGVFQAMTDMTETYLVCASRQQRTRAAGWERAMKYLAWITMAVMMFATVGQAQNQPSTAAGGDSDGKSLGGYQVEQSVELGYRFVNVNGNQAI